MEEVFLVKSAARITTFYYPFDVYYKTFPTANIYKNQKVIFSPFNYPLDRFKSHFPEALTSPSKPHRPISSSKYLKK